MHRNNKAHFGKRAVMLGYECLSLQQPIITLEAKVHDCLLHPEQESFSVRALIPKKLVIITVSVYLVNDIVQNFFECQHTTIWVFQVVKKIE